MDIYEKIVKLLVASGNVSEKKVEQARKLAESLVWDVETEQPITRTNSLDCGHSVEYKVVGGCRDHPVIR